jgi:hypothetical protein
MFRNDLTCNTSLLVEELKPFFWNKAVPDFDWKFGPHRSREIHFIPLSRRCNSLTATHTQEGSAVLN